MTFTELKNTINNYNTNHNSRFSYNPETCSLLIGEYEVPFDFTPEDYKDALDFIEHYGMFKEDKDCLGDELYYKGFKWNELTDEQRQSVLDKYEGFDNLVSEDRFEELFNENRSFLVF